MPTLGPNHLTKRNPVGGLGTDTGWRGSPRVLGNVPSGVAVGLHPHRGGNVLGVADLAGPHELGAIGAGRLTLERERSLPDSPRQMPCPSGGSRACCPDGKTPDSRPLHIPGRTTGAAGNAAIYQSEIRLRPEITARRRSHWNAKCSVVRSTRASRS